MEAEKKSGNVQITDYEVKLHAICAQITSLSAALIASNE
jgi:hypothetical protein